MAHLILQMTDPTQGGRVQGTWLSYKAEHLPKKMSEIVAEIDTTPNPDKGETAEEITAKMGMLNQFLQERCLQVNPDFDQEAYELDPENYAVPQYIHYDCTLEEFAMALNKTLGAEHVTVETAEADEAAAPKYYAMMFSLAEFLKKDWYNASLPFASEVELLQFFGRGKDAPDFTTHADNQGEGMAKWLRQTNNDLF